MLSRWHLCLVSSLLLGGCVEPETSLSSVEPAEGFVHETTAVVIHGENFLLDVTVDFVESDNSSVDDGFQAWLGDVPLLNVRYAAKDRLTAAVPPGLTLGAHPLRIVTPDGQELVLEEAFFVPDTWLQIEDDDKGNGAAIGDLNLVPGDQVPMFAVVRYSGTDSFAGKIGVGWIINGRIGTLTTDRGPDTILEAAGPGSGTVVARDPFYPDASTGQIVVR